jgi:peptidyl-dipeptidase Dcp
MKTIFPLTFSLLSVFPFFASAKNADKNPLLSPWTGRYGGLPPFDKIHVSDFKPALETSLQEARKNIENIANATIPATFENTINPLEKRSETLDRVAAIYGVWSSSLKSAEFQKVEQEMAPVLAAFDDEFYQNERLFARIESLYKNESAMKSLTSEQRRLVWYYHTQFVLRGAQLNSADKKRVAEINQRLATLSTQFEQNVLGDEEDLYLLLDSKSQLQGLSADFIQGAASEAERRGFKGKWLVANTRSSMEPFLTMSADRALREKAFRIWAARGDNDNAHNNNKIVTEILRLRTERSKLYGFPSYAHWHLADTMAKSPEAAMDLMMKVWKPALARVKQEVKDMQEIVDQEHGEFKIQAWDYRYYAEKVRKAKYDLDFEQVKPYLQLQNIQKAMFWSAEKLYGFKFVPLKKIAVFHPEVKVYEVQDSHGKVVGVWYFDPYARKGKNSGAWMSSYRDQHHLDGKNVLAIVSNNSNFIPAQSGEPILLSWDDAKTMFHEFGHALHGLNSKVNYPTLSGTNTTRDFVEFPSQFNENYLDTPEVLAFLKNKQGQTMPQALIEKIKKANTFNQGFSTLEFLASAIVDMKLHLSTNKEIDPKVFEKETLQEIGMPSEIIMRHRIPHFGHIFSGEGYSAGYYGYLWAQVLEKDAFEAFTEAHGPFDPAVAKSFQEHIMSIGNTQDPAEAYRQFRGRDAKADALLRSRGFPLTDVPATH